MHIYTLYIIIIIFVFSHFESPITLLDPSLKTPDLEKLKSPNFNSNKQNLL